MSHISVCVLTYKRSGPLERLLKELLKQETEGAFTYSIVVTDNDVQRSAEQLVLDIAAKAPITIRYCVEPKQNISLARNRAIGASTGDFIAFIDDDEFPESRWLLTLFEACKTYAADGVLGPVKCHFNDPPPQWVIAGKFYERPSHPTGFKIDCKDGRTGNVLLRKALLGNSDGPFNADFHRGGDTDFFRRMIADGHLFVWCDEAVVYEVVPSIRWTRSFMLKRALLRGMIDMQHPTRYKRMIRALVAVPVYTVVLPFSLLFGQHRFMNILIRLCDHLASLMTFAGIKPLKSQLITD